MAMKLFRPVGVAELRLIKEANWKGFPPRLPEQPIFYPVLNREYAQQIAREWNTLDPVSGYAGFVTLFEVPDDYASRFERRVVGARTHEELWVPAEELEKFNTQMTSPIQVIDSFYGDAFDGEIDPTTGLPAM